MNENKKILVGLYYFVFIIGGIMGLIMLFYALNKPDKAAVFYDGVYIFLGCFAVLFSVELFKAIKNGNKERHKKRFMDKPVKEKPIDI